MQKFQFDGNWITRLSLPLIAQKLNNPAFVHNDREEGFYPLEIQDSEDLAPDPAPAQVEAIHFLQNHQEEILEAIFTCFRDQVYPFVMEEWGVSPDDDPDLFPAFKTVADLRQVAGLSEIYIYNIEKDGMAYVTLTLNGVLDILTITFYGATPIHFSPGLNRDASDEILEHAGEEQRAQLAERAERYHEMEAQKLATIRRNGPFLPDPRSGKLKPWQEDANQFYPFGLIHQDDLDGFKALLNDSRFAPYLDRPGLLSVATSQQKQAFIDLLSSQDAIDNVYPALCETIENADLVNMQRLLPQETDINAQRGQESYLFKLMKGWYGNADDSARVAAYREAIILFIAQGANPYLQERWSRNAFYAMLQMTDHALRDEIEAFVKALAEQYERVPDTDIPPNDVMGRARLLLGK